MRTKYSSKKVPKLNLIPIMDAVFIFIFFLLMSAQFVDIFEIGSHLPMVKDSSENPNKDEPLNLNIEILDEKIIVKTGPSQKVRGEFNESEWEKFEQLMMGLKKAHPKENVVTLEPKTKVAFQRVVKVIDKTQKDQSSNTKLFEQVVFKK
jgi:biopolymer transport protein ExbD